MARSLLVLTALLGLSSFLTLTQAAVTYNQDVEELRLVQNYASQLQQDADKLTLTDDATLVVNMGGFEAVLKDLQQIDGALNNATSGLEGIAFQICAGQPLENAFYDFINTLDDALKALEDKAGLFTVAPELGSQVANGVREVKDAFDNFVTQLAEACQDSAAADESTGRGEDNQFDTVINTYSGGAGTKEILGGGLGLPTVP